MFGVSAGRVEQRSLGKSPQNGDRPQTPQASAAFGDGDLIVGMATTYLALTTEKKKISMNKSFVNFQIAIFFYKRFSLWLLTFERLYLDDTVQKAWILPIFTINSGRNPCPKVEHPLIINFLTCSLLASSDLV